MIENIGTVSEAQAFRFTIALHQFCMPVVSGVAEQLFQEHPMQNIMINPDHQAMPYIGVGPQEQEINDNPPTSMDVPRLERYNARYMSLPPSTHEA